MDAGARPLVPRSEWLLDPGISFLNRGSYGAVPRTVLEEQRRLQENMERDPTKFLVLELPYALRASPNHLATFVKCAGSPLSRMRLPAATPYWLRSDCLRVTKFC
jgi:hypothetical protein